MPYFHSLDSTSTARPDMDKTIRYYLIVIKDVESVRFYFSYNRFRKKQRFKQRTHVVSTMNTKRFPHVGKIGM